MFSPFERMVAMRYLRARRREGFISVIAGFSLLGICLGVATLIVVMAVMNGFRQELFQRMIGVSGHIAVLSRTGAMTDYDSLARKLRTLPGVVNVSPMIEGLVLATRKGRSAGARVRGMRPADFRRRRILADNIRDGSLDNFDAPDTVILGYRLANQLRARIGDKITLISPQSTVTAFGTVPRMRSYRVAATFDVNDVRFDGGYLYMSLASAQKFFRLKGAVQSVELLLRNADLVSETRARIVKLIGARGRIIDWRQAYAALSNALDVERNVMFLILTLIIVVAAFNVVSSLIMLVTDKGRGIAIMRTMGATRGMIMRIFFLAGASVGLIGTVAGLALGIAMADNVETIRQWLQTLTGTKLFQPEIYFLSQLPAEISWQEVTVVGLMAVGLSFAATLYPSWRAARLDPVEALRYE